MLQFASISLVGNEPIIATYDSSFSYTHQYSSGEDIPPKIEQAGVDITSQIKSVVAPSGTDFQNQASMDSILNSLGTALGFTWTKTQDSANNKYNYTITTQNDNSSGVVD